MKLKIEASRTPGQYVSSPSERWHATAARPTGEYVEAAWGHTEREAKRRLLEVEKLFDLQKGVQTIASDLVTALKCPKKAHLYAREAMEAAVHPDLRELWAAVATQCQEHQ